MPDINAVIHNLLDVRETLELYRDAIGAQWIDDAIEILREKMVADSIAALKEQWAIKPAIHIVPMTHNDALHYYECGACGKPIDARDKYCRECGKRVRWDD